MSSHDARRAMLSASGLPVPFSMRDKVEADTPVLSATSRRLKPCCSRRRRTALPSSEVLTPVFFTMGEKCSTHRVLAARLCFIVGTEIESEWQAVSFTPRFRSLSEKFLRGSLCKLRASVVKVFPGNFTKETQSITEFA